MSCLTSDAEGPEPLPDQLRVAEPQSEVISAITTEDSQWKTTEDNWKTESEVIRAITTEDSQWKTTEDNW